MGEPARAAVSALGGLLASLGITSLSGRQPGEFTVEEAAEEAGLSRATMQRFLVARVKAGKLLRRDGVVNGRKGGLYRKP